ncbi:MAG: FG-GAP-like repeat-containing protein [Bacteroidota bacterium]
MRNIFTLIFLLSLSTVGWTQISWERYSYPVEGQLTILKIDDISWFQDNVGNVYSFGAHQWQTIPPPSSDFNYYLYHHITNDHLLGVFIDNQFQTYTATWKNGTWSTPRLLTNVPLRHLRSSKAGLFLFGDWGRLFTWESGQWKAISNPAENHITALAGISSRPNDYWLLEREGILHHRIDQRWVSTSLPLPPVEDINVLYPEQDGLHLVATSGKHFLWDGQTLAELPAFPLSGLIKSAYTPNRHILFNQTPEFLLQENHHWQTVTLPDYQSVTDATIRPDGQLILTTSNGDVYYETDHQAPYFIEVASHWYINGNPWDQTTSAQLVDYNSDGQMDLLLHHPKHHQQNRLYVANRPSRFEDVSNQLPTINHSTRHLVMHDITGDKRPDLLTSHATGDATLITIYYQDTDGSFFPTQQLRFPLDGFLDLRDLDLFDWDQDGDPDLILTFYKSTAVDPGFVAWIPNQRYGYFDSDELQILPGSEGWNMNSLVEDLNQDDAPDLYISTFWTPDKLLLQDGDSIRVASNYLPPSDSSNTHAALTIDWDNDGDLDLVRADQLNTITVLDNQGNGQYQQHPITDTLRSLLGGYHPYDMTKGDFNNDGFPDLALLRQHKKQQYLQLLLNKSGEKVIDYTQQAGLLPYPANHILTHDFNGDGMDDMFTSGNSHNQLLLNQYHPDPSNATAIDSSRGATNIFSKQRLSQLIPMFFLRIRAPHFIYFVGLFVLASIITLGGIGMGISYFHWTPTLSSAITMINFSAFWITIDQFGTAHWLFGMGLPIVIVIVGVVLPLGISYQLERIERDIPDRQNAQQLLTKLLEFSHGTWAMSVLNSLRMLSRNADPQRVSSPQLSSQLQERYTAFTTLLAPELDNITDMVKQSDWKADFYLSLEKAGKHLSQQLGSSADHFSQRLKEGNGEQIAQAIEQLRQVLRQLRHAVFSQYSSKVTSVTDQVTRALRPELRKNKITIALRVPAAEDYWALIPSGDLANILDNCIHNAQKAIQDGGSGRITITVRKSGPRIQMDISDNGTGIAKQDLDHIFEQGFSRFKSTGLGLYQARQTLQRYGGDIWVKATHPDSGTTFTISLLEGVSP